MRRRTSTPRSAVAGLWVVLLAACATTPAPAPTGASFELTGRVAVRSAQDAVSGGLLWRHGPGFDDLMISTPLGQGVAEITRRAGRYTLVTADARRISATDPEALTEQALGWRLPLAGLPDWVRGRPYPEARAETRYSQDGRVQLIRQLGWTIEYLGYDERTGLPTRIRLKRDSVDIRLTIDSWSEAPQ
jgi:outer membrane lipoprotein LolB